MIKFFRKIRQKLLIENKTSKYFKYAFGEIILVVIGILIALQINNWNENRKESIKEKATLQKFLDDIKADAINFETNFTIIKNIDTLHTQLYAYTKKPDSIFTLKFPNFIRRQMTYITTARENNPEIINKISQEKIREEIQNYFRSMNLVLDGKNEFEDVVFKIREFIRIQKLHNVSGWFETSKNFNKQGHNHIIKEEDLLLLTKNPYFQQLLFESNLKLHEVKSSLESLIESNQKLTTQIATYLAK